MKNIIYKTALALLLSGTIITGCKSTAEKEDAAKDNVEDAKENLKEVQADANAQAQKIATAEEWSAFKSESEEKIAKNEARIAELKVKLKKPGTILDPVYEKRIETLESRNRDLRARMDAYEKNQSDWESFKREFNHDMDELGQSLKDFTVDNK